MCARSHWVNSVKKFEFIEVSNKLCSIINLFVINFNGICKVLLRRTGMPGAVIVRISIREYDNNILQNVNNNRRSTRSIPHITKR